MDMEKIYRTYYMKIYSYALTRVRDAAVAVYAFSRFFAPIIYENHCHTSGNGLYYRDGKITKRQRMG